MDRFLNTQIENLAKKAGWDLNLDPKEEKPEAAETAPSGSSQPAKSSGSDGDADKADGAESASPSEDAAATPLPIGGSNSLIQSGVFESNRLTSVYVSPKMKVSNTPKANANGAVTEFSPLIDVQGVFLSAAPISHGCLSSGYGSRSGKMHRGVDYHSESHSDVFAAADGIVVEAEYRNDFGNMIVVDHGSSVYTRYAHLGSFADGIKTGTEVTSSTILGPMGSSGGRKVVTHLHYEVLTGDYNTAAKSFGLTPTDPLGKD